MYQVLKKNGLTMVKNTILVALKDGDKTHEEISALVGVPADHIKKFANALIQEKKIIEKDGKYSLP